MSDPVTADQTQPAINADETGGAVSAPVGVADRIESLDFIRGIAVMGILVANIVAFGQPFSAYMYPEAFLTEHGEVSEWLAVAQYVLIDTKMRGLFTLLFGAGLYLFMERAWARGQTRWLQVWRLAVLLLFGAIHFYLIWIGDILMYYALIGFAVVPMLRLSAKTQMGIGLTGYLAGAIFFGAAMTVPYLVAETDLGENTAFAEAATSMETAKTMAFANDRIETQLIQSGDWVGLVSHRVVQNGLDPIGNVLFFGFETLPFMLIGIALYRTGFFSGAIERSTLLKWGWIGVSVGGAMSLAIGVWLKSEGFSYYGTLAAFMGWSPIPQFFMVLGIAALLVAYSPGWTGWLADRVRAAGRAAFTNYLGTSLVMIFVFQGWGLGLFGELNRPQLYGVTFLTCALMLTWSKPWLDRFRYGPLEWLWRCLTYRKMFPLKR
ncbi:DUF418 domain-containing protein [Erythrobacter sp. Alg231-14]|uniref:DUF418 domain-containing protein n=1 Tax=Erythrobacter sp. Alg231-14 TaxID=1922225 RepID=UPI00307C1723